MNRRSAPEISGKGNQIPPSKSHVLIYFLQKGKTEKQAMEFFDYWEERKWLNAKCHLIADWKVTAWEWIWYKKF